MNKIYFEVEDNVVIKHTPILEIGENINLLVQDALK